MIGVNDDLSIEEQTIVDFIIKNGKIQRSEVMELLGCGETKAN
jgi:hypothetical protein